LETELDEAKRDAKQVSAKISKLEAAGDHLRNERIKVEQKIKMLHEELELIDCHLETQDQRYKTLKTAESDVLARVVLISQTLGDVQAEMQKYGILMEGAMEHHV